MNKYDLEKLWDEHTKYEFATPDVEATLATMVEDAYVNHVPVMTGGKGKSALRAFYGTDFIPCMPPDFKMTDVSRTVGENRLVDEMVRSASLNQKESGLKRKPTQRGGGCCVGIPVKQRSGWTSL